MKTSKLLAAAVISLCLAGTALAAADPAQYVLTQPVYNKVMAVQKEVEKAGLKEEDDDGEDLDTVDDIVKMIESKPAAKAILARHGVSPKDYALTVLAVFHAGFHVAMEPQMDKQGQAKLMAGYTKAQQQNIVFMRAQKK
jgi:hypothetical protein